MSVAVHCHQLDQLYRHCQLTIFLKYLSVCQNPPWIHVTFLDMSRLAILSMYSCDSTTKQASGSIVNMVACCQWVEQVPIYGAPQIFGL